MLNESIRSGKGKGKRSAAQAAADELNADEIVRLSLDMPKEMHKRFKALCAQRELSMKDVALSEIRRWMQKEEKKILESLRAVSESEK